MTQYSSKAMRNAGVAAVKKYDMRISTPKTKVVSIGCTTGNLSISIDGKCLTKLQNTNTQEGVIYSAITPPATLKHSMEMKV